MEHITYARIAGIVLIMGAAVYSVIPTKPSPKEVWHAATHKMPQDALNPVKLNAPEWFTVVGDVKPASDDQTGNVHFFTFQFDANEKWEGKRSQKLRLAYAKCATPLYDSGKIKVGAVDIGLDEPMYLIPCIQHR